MKYRSQVWSDTTQRWVDGGLFSRRRDAEFHADMLLDMYGEHCSNRRVVDVEDDPIAIGSQP